ncbi:hypothetical protein F5Y18DRAFT_426152 [Xylariaceae sp. FL1019]|nr:hypothetical protein F5Y18DRAFT_426152 [Xylariaceae sp. FL1019]
MATLDFDLERYVPELTHKVVLITGGTNGHGAATATMIAHRNSAKIYITGRNEVAAQESFRKSNQQKATETVISNESRLYVLMGMACPPALTKDGYELQFGLNHAAHALAECGIGSICSGNTQRLQITNIN